MLLLYGGQLSSHGRSLYFRGAKGAQGVGCGKGMSPSPPKKIFKFLLENCVFCRLFGVEFDYFSWQIIIIVGAVRNGTHSNPDRVRWTRIPRCERLLLFKYLNLFKQLYYGPSLSFNIENDYQVNFYATRVARQM